MSVQAQENKLDPLQRPYFARGWLARPYDFLARDVWEARLNELPLPQRIGYRAGRVFYLAARGFFLDQIGFRAAALTYITVLSLVPLLAFSFSVVKGLGYYEKLVNEVIDPALDRMLGEAPPAVVDPAVQASDPASVQASETGSEMQSESTSEQPSAPPSEPGPVESQAPPSSPGVQTMQLRSAIDRVLRFVDETNFQHLGGLGLAILLYAVIRLLNTVETSFNTIWGVKRPRSPVRKVSDYLTMVIVTPIFLLTAISLTTTVEESQLVSDLRLGVVVENLLRLAPLVSAWLAFTFFYMVLPNTRTRLYSALIGGFLAAVMWQIALLLHVKFQVGIAKYNAIYSSFAAIPIFLVWVNLSWTIVMVGAEVAYAHQNEHVYRRVAGYRDYGHSVVEKVALRVMARISSAFLEGNPPHDAEGMASDLRLPLQPVEDVLHRLREQCLLVAVEPIDAGRYVPAKDPGLITVKSVLDALKASGAPAELPPQSSSDREVDRLLDRLGHEQSGSAYNLTLRELAQHSGEEELAGEAAGEPRPQPS